MSTKSRKARETAADDHLDPAAPVIPWPEWTDAELNGEKWDFPKNGTDGHFLDPEPRVMPPSIEPYDWKRASLLKNLSSGPVVFTPSNEYPNFVKNNKHILHSEFVRWFISTIINLQYVGRNGIQIERESPNFITSIDSQPWHGWLYVYSMNKAGSSASAHQPVVNPNGKYVIRLHFMGFWRRFVVDDTIPVDINDTPLLPRTESDFELWPMLLAKAMMKLAALSWTHEREILNFHPVSCFTGWICLPLAAKYLLPNDKWQLLRKYGDVVGEVEMSANKQSIATPSGKEKADNKKAKKQDPLLPLVKNSHPKVLIFANISNATEPGEENDVPEVTPCFSHPIYIDKLKDLGFETSQTRWKMYRYFDWASKHGVFKGSENGPSPGVRSLKLISPLKRCLKEGLIDESAEEESVEKGSKVSGRIAARTRETPDRETVLPEIGVWVDFVKISHHLEEILMFYKPSDFEYYARVSDLIRSPTAGDSQLHVSAAGSSRAKSSQSTTGGKDGRKAHTVSASSVPRASSFQSLLKWQQNVSSCRNEPLYMLVDSTDTKFFLIDFCAMPKPSPTFTRSYLIIEKYDFFERSTDDDDPTALIKTFSTGATIFEAQPGRHLYRLLFRSRNSYFIRILSDTIFHLGDRFRMYDLMTSESDRVDVIAKNISNRITEAFQEFGKPGYASRLRAFYNSYNIPREEDMTHLNVQKKLTKNIHRVFIEELERLVKETFSSSESEAICRALRVFFINVRHCELKSKESPGYSTSERAAVRIQSFFRMALVKIYKKMHDPSHIRHSEILLNLRKVIELFNYLKRESIAHLLIRKVIWSTRANGTSVYPCHPDLNQVLNIEEWKGVVRNIQPGQWVPIFRVVLNTPNLESTVFAGIDLATNLPRYVIRVVNNETYREMPRLVNGLAPSRYPYVKRGYTLIGYGWSDGQKIKELDWTVRVITVKGQPTFRQMSSSRSSLSLIGAKPPSLLVQELSNNYVPNFRNMIGKWIVTIFSDSIVTLRLTTSYNMVETLIIISDKDGKVLCEATGGSVLILPATYLSLIGKRTNGKGSGDATKAPSRSESLILIDSAKDDQVEETTAAYYVEAYVANDSWPLTSAEWTVAKEAKARGTVYDPMYGRTSVSSVSKRAMKVKVPAGRGSEDKLYGDGDMKSDSTSRTIFQHPLCRLQVTVDVGSKVQVEQDRNRETEIAGMKRLWEDAEPGRLLRGRELREEFFRSNSTDQPRSTSSEESIKESISTLEIRTLKPPSNLPPWNIATYMSKDEEDDEDERWVKTEDDEEMLRNQRAINILDFEEAHATYLDEEMALIEEQRQRNSDQLNSYLNKVTYWKGLVDTAYEKRDGYVADIKSAVSPDLIKNGKDTKTKKKNRKKAK